MLRVDTVSGVVSCVSVTTAPTRLMIRLLVFFVCVCAVLQLCEMYSNIFAEKD